MSTVTERSIALGGLGILLAAVRAFGPLLWPYGLDPTWSVPDEAWLFLVDLLWVAAMVITYRNDPLGRMWKLFLLFQVVAVAGVAWVVPTSLSWTLSQLSVGLASVVFVHLVLAFPSGRLWSRYDRIVVGSAYAFVAATRLGWILVWRPVVDKVGFSPRNPFVLWPNGDLAWMLGPGAIVLMTPLLFVAVLVGLWLHWRSASPALRRAILPLTIAAPLQLAITVAWQLAGVVPAQGSELREILQHPLLGAAGLVFPLGFLLGSLRARWARSGIADLAIELGQGVPLGSLSAALARALRDPTLQLAFPAPSGDGYVDPDGSVVILPTDRTTRTIARLEHAGEPLAWLIYDPAIEREDPGRVGAVASVATLALENERLAAQVRAQLEEVRASRARIVDAGDAERRRIERDLHDGAQQRLVALAMRLDQARGGSLEAAALIDATTTELLTAIAEVRNLARGVHPTLLTEVGLAAAVDALAERSPIPVTTRVVERRLPPQVETAAYYVVAEGLTNAARYSGATEVVVEVVDQESQLMVMVSDDGRGGADLGGGTGLRGLVDRLAVVGGGLHVRSASGAGTTLTATIPLTRGAADSEVGKGLPLDSAADMEGLPG